MTYPASRWQKKAQSAAEGWKQRFGTYPATPTLAVLLGVAEGETACGDSWPGENNIGAVQLRSLHPDELAVLSAAGIHPASNTVPAARAALAAAVAAGTIAPEPNGALHVDTHPGGIYYFVFFRRFATEAQGFAFFVGVIARTDAEKAALEAGDAGALAAAMRSSGYYEGRHDNHTPEGQAANIADYTAMISRSVPVILAALASWTPPGATADTLPPPDGEPGDWFD